MIKAFVITAEHETSRRANVHLLKSQLPGLEEIEAVYPTREHVPFINQLISTSKKRTGTALNPGEIGVLLSNRKIWRKITHMANNNSDRFLVLESDSHLLNVDLLHRHYHELSGSHDLFFFGAWSGHARLLRSTKKNWKTGTQPVRPLLKQYMGRMATASIKKQLRTC
jgi:GR25 family glycosyltransferase involved in LPS biosynthesis